MAASLPVQYGTRRPWVHTVDTEVILHLLWHADRERTTGVPACSARAVNQMPLRWLQNSLRVRGHHTKHPFWFAWATSRHSNALLHKADWAASEDTVLQNRLPGPSHAQLIVAGTDGHLDLRPPTMQTLGPVAQRAQLDHTSMHRGHTPLGTARAMAYVDAREPHRGGHQLASAASQGRPHTGATQAPHPEEAALRRHHPRTAVPPLRGPRCNFTWTAPTRAPSGPTTARWCKRRPDTSRPGTRRFG